MDHISIIKSLSPGHCVTIPLSKRTGLCNAFRRLGIPFTSKILEGGVECNVWRLSDSLSSHHTHKV
jgi:hypothetical protein